MTTYRVELDRERCQGYGNCVLVAPDLFDIDDEGLAVVKATLVGESQLADVRRAAYDCPTDSIAFVELTDDDAPPAAA